MSLSSRPPALLPPLIITIGPQCAGKTTYISQQLPHAIDITMDDQPFTYESILKTDLIDFLQSPSRVARKDRRIFGRLLFEDRVTELINSEQLLLLQRFNNVQLFIPKKRNRCISTIVYRFFSMQRISHEDFMENIGLQMKDEALRVSFLSIVEALLSEDIKMVVNQYTVKMSIPLKYCCLDFEEC